MSAERRARNEDFQTADDFLHGLFVVILVIIGSLSNDDSDDNATKQ